MGNAELSSGELRKFVFYHELMNKRSIIQFNAIINIDTEKNEIKNLRSQVMITLDEFNSYGKVTLLNNDIDPYTYPTVLEANWQTFTHVNNEFLEVTGNHTRNQNIGKYSVRIIPLERLRE